MTDYVEAIPDEIEICPKCKSHVMWDLPAQGGMWCYRCSARGKGLPYRRIDKENPRLIRKAKPKRVKRG